MYVAIGTRTFYATTRCAREWSCTRSHGELQLRLGFVELWLGRRVRRGVDPLVSIEV